VVPWLGVIVADGTVDPVVGVVPVADVVLA
jgi:hypothetical protein